MILVRFVMFLLVLGVFLLRLVCSCIGFDVTLTMTLLVLVVFLVRFVCFRFLEKRGLVLATSYWRRERDSI
jgi:hypothetical protein